LSQDYGRCRNGKGRLKQKWVGRGDPKWGRKEKVKDQGREDIIYNNLHIYIKVQKILCQIEYLQTKSLFKKICFRHDIKADSESTNV
jgi:hypothetical protein